MWNLKGLNGPNIMTQKVYMICSRTQSQLWANLAYNPDLPGPRVYCFSHYNTIFLYEIIWLVGVTPSLVIWLL